MGDMEKTSQPTYIDAFKMSRDYTKDDVLGQNVILSNELFQGWLRMEPRRATISIECLFDLFGSSGGKNTYYPESKLYGCWSGNWPFQWGVASATSSSLCKCSWLCLFCKYGETKSSALRYLVNTPMIRARRRAVTLTKGFAVEEWCPNPHLD